MACRSQRGASRALCCRHRRVDAATAPLPVRLTELDDLIGQRVGHEAQLALLDEVACGAYRLEPFAAEDVDRARRIMEKFIRA